MDKNLVRKSNMEALRIVAMSFIMIHHFLLHSIDPENFPYDLFPIWDFLVYSGVNIFFFISGYFTIQFSAKRVVRFFLMVMFFVLVNILLLDVLGDRLSFWISIKRLLHPLSYYWFLMVYFLLMLSAPIINKGLNGLSNRGLITSIVALLIGVFYLHSGAASCNYLNGLLLYIIGYASSRFKLAHYCKARTWILMYATVMLSAIIIQLASLKLTGNFFDLYSYDNFLNILTTIFISLFFARLSFQKRWVNSLASASFGCYLLQDGILGSTYIYKVQNQFFETYGFGLEVLAMFVISFILYWTLSWLLTKFLNVWINQLSDSIAHKIKRVVDYTFRISLLNR